MHYSYGYYLITGRNGAWLYQNNKSACIICLHPNNKQELLVYPPIGNDLSTLSETLNLLSSTPLNIRIARVPANQTEFMSKQIKRDCNGVENCVPENETILDWLYPTYVLSTTKATEQSGKDLHQVRKECRKLDQNEIEFLPFSGHEDQALEVVAHQYAKLFLEQNSNYPLSYQEIAQPVIDVLELCKKSPEVFSIYVTWHKNKPEGFFVWEKLSDDTANALWFLYNRNIRGLSYTQMIKACETLKEEGIQRVNFGGSETAGLDQFKRKFKPVQSFQLQSIALSLKTNAFMLDSDLGRIGEKQFAQPNLA